MDSAGNEGALSSRLDDALKTIRSYWASVAPCVSDSGNGIILVDLFHGNVNYTLRSLLIAKYLQKISGRVLVGLLGKPGVVIRSCGDFDLGLNRMIAKSFGVETIWEVDAPEVQDRAEALDFLASIERGGGGLASPEEFRGSLSAAQRLDGFPLGRFIYDTTVRAELCATVAQEDPSLVRWAADTIHLENWFRSQIGCHQHVSPILVTGHIDYNPWGVISELILKGGGDVYWFSSETAFTVYRIAASAWPERMLAGRVALIEKQWFNETIWPLGAQLASGVALFQRCKQLRIFNQSWTTRLRRDPVREVAVVAASAWKAAYGWDSCIPVVIVFAHALADQPLSSGSVYVDRYVWLTATVAFAAAHPERNWIIKIHPSDLVYDASKTVAYLMDRYLNLRHVRFILGEMSMAIMVELGDLAATIFSSAGLQFAAAGKPVICTADGRYSGCGFVHQAQTEQEYHSLLLSSPRDLAISRDQIYRAQLFEYVTAVSCAHYSTLLHNEMDFRPGLDYWPTIERRFRHHNLSKDELYKSLCRMVRDGEQRFAHPDIVALDVGEVPASGILSAPVLSSDKILAFGQGNDGSESLLYGFHDHERWGAWTNGDLAIVGFSLDLPDDQIVVALQLECNTLPGRRVQILLKDAILWEGTSLQTICFNLPLPPADGRGTRYIALAIRCENPASPSELGFNEDVRKLGLGLKRLGVVSEKVVQPVHQYLEVSSYARKAVTA